MKEFLHRKIIFKSFSFTFIEEFKIHGDKNAGRCEEEKFLKFKRFW